MQVVLFELGRELFGLSAQCVEGVVTPAPVTPLPFVPEFVSGLVGHAGQVITQIDLARRLGRASGLAEEDGVLLVVRVGAVPLALHIQRVLSMIQLPPEAVYYATTEGDGESAEGFSPVAAPVAVDSDAPCKGGPALIVGEFSWSGRTVLLLDTAHLGLDAIAPQGIPAGSDELLGLEPAVTTAQPTGGDERIPGLVVESGGEWFALRLEQVQEVLEAVAITPLPHAPPVVAGIAFLRNLPVLFFYLNRLMGLSDEPEPPRMMVMVQCHGERIGLLVRRVVGIERFALGDCHSANADDGELEFYLRGHAEKMIGLINLPGVFTTERWAGFRHLLPQTARRGGAGLAAGGGVVRPFLAFQVGSDPCVIPLSLVERVTEFKGYDGVPENSNAMMDGVVQIQGAVLPVADLRRRFHSRSQEDIHTAYLVVKVSAEAWALAVDRVFRVVNIPETDLELGKQEKAGYVSGVGKLNGVIYSVLSVAPLEPAA